MQSYANVLANKVLGDNYGYPSKVLPGPVAMSLFQSGFEQTSVVDYKPVLGNYIAIDVVFLSLTT